MAPKPPSLVAPRRSRGAPRSESQVMGPRDGPPNPPSRVAPRRSRGAPRSESQVMGPRDAPQTPHRSSRPGGAVARLDSNGGPDMAPKPPIARRAPAEPWRASIQLGAPTWPPDPLTL